MKYLSKIGVSFASLIGGNDEPMHPDDIFIGLMLAMVALIFLLMVISLIF